MLRRSLYPVLILGMVAILAAVALQGYYLYHAYDLKDRAFRRQVEVALMGVADGFEELNNTLVPDVALINRVAEDYYVVNLNSAIDAEDLEYLLQRELAAAGVHEAFEYGVYDCYGDQMVYGDYVGFDDGEEPDLAGLDPLPTYDEFIYYFGVRFPEHRASIITSLGTSGALAGVLIVTILFFAYASFVLVRQQQLSEMQRDFINNMTHEFKTPISTIKVASGVLSRAPVVQADARLARYADIVERQNERLTAQVEKVLQLARMERDRFRIQPEETRLDTLVAEACEGARAKVEAGGGTFDLVLGAPERVVEADRLHFTGALAALLDNAVKYSPGTPRVSVRTERLVDGTDRVTVADRGVGIPAEHRSRVFEKFFRVPTGDVHDVKGFGLGLFYVGGVCRAHGFELSIDPERVDGTAFRIDIPPAQRASDAPFWRKLKTRIFGPAKSPAWTQA